MGLQSEDAGGAHPDEPPCPSWCLATADDHARDEPGTRLHQGPSFGLLRTWWLEGPDDEFTVTVDEAPDGDLTADDLRRLATDALDAAIWIDRQARIGSIGRGRSVVDLVREAHDRATRSA